MVNLTKAQKREIDFLKNNEGYRWISRHRLRMRNVYWHLEKKGLVRLIGSMHGEVEAYLIEEKGKNI